jgi:diaminobutyrate-2-oxoglutarate transaminase
VKEFRGRGLMVGLELNNPDKADLIANKCCENGLLLLTSGPNNVIRLIPALTITDEELKTGLTILEDVIASVD